MANARIAKIFGKTALQALPTIFGIVVLNFLLLKMLPGDVADTIAMESGSATEESMAAIRERLGLNLGLFEQVVNYLNNLAHFDLGKSARLGVPVTDLIVGRLPDTLLLVLSALGFALVIGIVLGWVMSAFAGKWPDRVISVVLMLIYAIPGFWLGLMAIVLFSVTMNWLPSNGNASIGAGLTGLDAFVDRLRHLIMPALSLSLFYAAVYARLTRATMLEVQQQDFMRTAAAKGLHPVVLQFRHALRNALIPVTTVAGMHLGNMLGGAMVVETVFGWPGMGRLALDSVVNRDFSVLLGILLLSSILVIIANVVVDILQSWLDPRIELR
ncbi:ABC transporter permease [Mesorhizobium australicum]|uniref:Peptide/nickel transport system permease protein n=1 Tax=Mesorhizobium australicum TaxID=536018 RepID=A0A1X7PR84_9HYPH|nr:ABC transporter permease [Mesorhizobium australicum]SMH53927.1 peptide/nickel transport system permease protein [Mesorhizobium australicum]